jgi:hypothetical protein
MFRRQPRAIFRGVCTTYLTEGQLSKKIWFEDTPEDGARLASKHVG